VVSTRRCAPSALAEAFLERTPHDPRSRLARARVAAFFHRFPEALADLDAAAVLGLDQRSLNAERAKIFVSAGRLACALALHKDALSTRRDFNALGGMACYYAVCGEVAEADAWFLAPRNVYRGVSPFPLAVLEFQCGQMWLAQGELVRAGTWLESAVRRLPAFVLAQGHFAAIDAAEASTPPRAVITSSGGTK
jgi:tetratricopeptide (TPR) repeat protein